MPYQRPSGLIVPTAAMAGRPTMDELAPISGGRDITRGLIDHYPALPPQDSLAARSPGPSYLDLYQEVLDDWQVFSTLQARRLAVCATEWEVLPGGNRLRDRKAAELIEAILDALAWDRITAQMHYGLFFGHAVAEVLWQRDGANVVPGDIRVRDQRRFVWRPDGTLALLTLTDSAAGEAMPERKFWAFQTGAVHGDDPYGMGIAHWCYWPAQFKRGTVKLMLIALDKYASPTALGHFPPNASASERAKLLSALEAIRSQSALILPEGMQAELLSAARSGSADYLGALHYWDAAISKVIAGHSAAADATPGRLGGEDTGRDVRQDLVTADADLLCQSANATWVRWTIDWSYPGAAYPRIWRRMEADEELGARAEREAKIFTMGYRPTLAQIVDTYGGDWEEAGPADKGRPPAPESEEPQTPDAPPEIARAADPETADHAEPAIPAGQSLIDDELARDASREQQAAMERLISPILDALSEGLTPEQIMGRMDAWYGALDDSLLQELLTRGIAAADAIGRAEVQIDG